MNRFINFLSRNYDFEKLESALLMAEIQAAERIEDNEPSRISCMSIFRPGRDEAFGTMAKFF